MHAKRSLLTAVISILTILLATGGCDERVVEVAREASDRQAAQNRQMAELQQEVASGAHELVKSDAAARQELVRVHRDLQNERHRLSDSWNDLELERRRVEQQRHSGSIWLAATSGLVGTLVIVALLGFLWQLLANARQSDALDEELSELVIAHLLPNDTSEHRALTGASGCLQPAIPDEPVEN